MEKLKALSDIEIRELTGGQEIEVMTGYPGQSLVNFVWSTIKAAYQKGYDDKQSIIEPCRG